MYVNQCVSLYLCVICACRYVSVFVCNSECAVLYAGDTEHVCEGPVALCVASQVEDDPFE